MFHIHKKGTPEEQEVADKELAKFGMKYKDAKGPKLPQQMTNFGM